MTNDPTDLPGLIQTINEVSSKSDRWMFVALLVICLGAIYFLGRWLMARNDKLQERQDSLQKEFNSFLVNQNTTVANALTASNDMMKKMSETLETAADVLKQASTNIERRTH